MCEISPEVADVLAGAAAEHVAELYERMLDERYTDAEWAFVTDTLETALKAATAGLPKPTQGRQALVA